MSEFDPLNLNDPNPYRPNPYLNRVPSVPTFQCEICNWEAPSHGILQNHIYLLHQFPQIRPISPIADNSSYDSSENDKSPTLHENPNKNSSPNANTEPKIATVKKHKCPKCGVNFTRNNLIKRHLIKSCPKNTESKYYIRKKSGHKCDICNKLFSTITNRNQHIRNIHKSKPLENNSQ